MTCSVSKSDLGLYVSVPFCRGKCTFCNFASDAFAAEQRAPYVGRLCAEIREARTMAERMGCIVPETADTVYLGGGTPSLLQAGEIGGLFEAIRGEFAVAPGAEITMECAPGQIDADVLEAMLLCGVNRVSLGVQSFVDAEARAVGRVHTRAVCEEEIRRLRSAGVAEISVDLIAGLPGQTGASWRESLLAVLESGVPHASVYLFEVDEESRLGREVMEGGVRYGARRVPSDEETAEFYSKACEQWNGTGMRQYEISNFARQGHRSRHNMKYWRREPYLGFGLDAHSLLETLDGGSLRCANTDELACYMAGQGSTAGLNLLGRERSGREVERVGLEAAAEERLFLGLRMNEGVEVSALRQEFPADLLDRVMGAVPEIVEAGLLEVVGDRLQLTDRGRLASNEVFSRLLVHTPEAA